MNEVGAVIKVVLVDDHTLFREGIAQIFAADQSIQVVGEASNGEQAVAVVQKEQPDVVLLEPAMPSIGADEKVRMLFRVSPASRVIVLTMHDEPSLVRKLIGAGAHAFIAKTATRAELIAIISTVNHDQDRVVLSVSRTTLNKLEEPELCALSPREIEVLSLAAEGMSNRQIASKLYISNGTVKRHLTNAYAKLQVTSRVKAINKASSMGLLTFD